MPRSDYVKRKYRKGEYKEGVVLRRPEWDKLKYMSKTKQYYYKDGKKVYYKSPKELGLVLDKWVKHKGGGGSLQSNVKYNPKTKTYVPTNNTSYYKDPSHSKSHSSSSSSSTSLRGFKPVGGGPAAGSVATEREIIEHRIQTGQAQRVEDFRPVGGGPAAGSVATEREIYEHKVREGIIQPEEREPDTSYLRRIPEPEYEKEEGFGLGGTPSHLVPYRPANEDWWP